MFTRAWGQASIAVALIATAAAGSPAATLGIFDGQSDVGSVTPQGTAEFEAFHDRYTISAAGANTWYHVDAFHYVWKKMSGDVSLSAQVSFPPHLYGHEPNPHRKALLMFRQTLDAGSAYVDAAPHGSGLVALQYRTERGANSQDIEINIDAPQSLRLEKRGDVFTLYLSMHGEPLHPVGAATSLHLKEPFYVGLGAVSHDVDSVDRFEFSGVSLRALAPIPAATKIATYSTLQTIQVDDQFRRAMMIRNSTNFMRAPNWAPDGKSIMVLESGRLQRIPILAPEAGGTPQPLDMGQLEDCIGDFGMSPDGRWLAASCASAAGAGYQIYIAPTGGGGSPRQLTVGTTPSYFHAWSADGQRIAFTRGTADKADIFTMAASGGAEVQLTRDTSNDGPEFSPDGKFIYFHSSRSGSLQIWRMRADGSAAEQITDDDHPNVWPHVSPDGKALAFMSQPAQSGPGIGAAAIRVMYFSDGMIRNVVDFQGDRGSFSMYPWGDNNHLAFISYQSLPEESR